ncbi:MAG: methyltransferase domain-containing protein [Verrucomicrobiia bacterium]
MPEVRGKDWDQYWVDSAKNKGLFEVIAKFYRRFIISPAVRYYFHKYFADTQGRVYLHAGCGSAESDNRIGLTNARFVLMDISPEALAIARRKTALTNVHLVCGDIFNPPFKTGCIDGLWNLGVMEHFRETEIVSIFSAFSRILKPQARCLIFWPPRYGLTVIVLTSFLCLANRFRKQPLVLYPDEVSRFSSKGWAQQLAAQSGLKVDKAHFGIRDAFTYVVLILARS